LALVLLKVGLLSFFFVCFHGRDYRDIFLGLIFPAFSWFFFYLVLVLVRVCMCACVCVYLSVYMCVGSLVYDFLSDFI